MASAPVFGMYGVDTDWINFLTHGNQFRARLDQLGFTLGNDTIKGTFGFDNNTGYGGVYGDLLSKAYDTSTPAQAGTSGDEYNFRPSISMGLGYTSSLISVGVGYNVTLGPRIGKQNGKPVGEEKLVQLAAHTPVLVLNAMDNAFRMAIPIQVYALNDKNPDGTKLSINAVSVDSQFRYYTGLDMLPQIRLYLRYGGGNFKAGDISGKIGESFGFDFRLYFGSMVEEVALKPYVKLVYNGALGKYHKNTRVEVVKVMNSQDLANRVIPNLQFAKSAWNLNLVAGLGLTANSDIVSLYLEPTLGLKVEQAGSIDKNAKEIYSLGYGVYAEIYITPLKNLEWYFEAQLGNLGGSGTYTTTDAAGTTTTHQVSFTKLGLGFNATTGITWYLPAL